MLNCQNAKLDSLREHLNITQSKEVIKCLNYMQTKIDDWQVELMDFKTHLNFVKKLLIDVEINTPKGS